MLGMHELMLKLLPWTFQHLIDTMIYILHMKNFGLKLDINEAFLATWTLVARTAFSEIVFV